MAPTDTRFEGYNPAPMNHSVVDRGARLGAGAITGGVGGTVLGAVATPIISGVVGAALTGFVLLGGAAFFGAAGAVLGIGGFVSTIAWAAPTVGAVSLFAGIASGIAGLVGAPLGAVLGGTVGAFRGAARENSRVGIDQSLYNLQMGALQAQQPAIYVQPQPANGPVTGMVPAPHRDAVSEEAARMDTKINEASAKIPVASSIQHDGMMIDANRTLARL